MRITPVMVSFIKTVVLIAIVPVLMYLENAANLTGVVNPMIAAVIAGLASAFEKYLSQQSGNTTALMGTVSLKQ